MPSNTPADQEVTRRYFELSLSIEAAKRRGDYKAAITAARETFPLLGRFVAAAVRDYGRWDIGFSHAVHTASSLMAVEEDRAAIADLRNTLRVIPKLSDWLPVADQADEDLAIIGHVKAAIRAQPGIRQAELRDAIGLPDGKRLSVLVGYLERGGHIRRVRTGKTYELYAVDSPAPKPKPDAPTDTASAPAPPASSLPPTTVTSPASWQGRSPRQPRDLDLGRLRVIRLPVAPPAWDQAPKSRLDTPPAAKKAREAPAFTVTGDGWSVAEERKLAPEERPDPAFKQSYAGRRWIYWLDSRGRTTRWPEAPSILQITDATGAVIAERGLGWDVYRIDTNVDGSAILFLSRDGVLHGYYHDLQPLLVARVRDLPEYRACAARLGIPDEHLKNHVRCVATSTDHTRYIVTVVDEAWCLSTTGEVLWGLRFPTSERWAPVSRSVELAGSSSKVLQALTLIGLTLPVTPEDMTHAYRRRALEWHPDRNPGDPSAVRLMQELNAAMALLAGTDVSALTVPQIERVERYEDLTSRQTMGSRTLGISLTMSMTVGPLTAADWIYAANFGESGRVYLAGYSGRVVELNPEGNPVRVYDIGAVPRHVAETTQYLYLLTDTRLYIVKGTQLVALLDMFEQGRLIVSDTGLGLLEEKAFTWLSPTGQLIGAVRSRDPIRRVLRTTEGLVVESRQRRALVHGTPPWW